MFLSVVVCRRNGEGMTGNVTSPRCSVSNHTTDSTGTSYLVLILLSTGSVGERLPRSRYRTLLYKGEVLEAEGKDPAALTWDSIKRGLMKYFAPVNAARALRDEWHGSRQTTSVGEYVTRLNNLRIQIPEIRDIEFLDKFIHGLKPKVRLELELRNPQTLDEAIMIADRYDSITFSNRILN
ncbi:hypothetical protein G7K_1453-t1 [Saitoella complicata NRRL Y-17804]|uniref:Retrotransposon gag domain-containing protein n=1 Tax=Saitoella complicata (strain BCRC 22490 / CBS 7301 / JCM 7358 / NBRC 10748 / NRRL Y-17804) TaxID=698492 RepID=A0A0E9NBR2_SAICN|nr:hypothetical protein G7K_1453-t1 [Saitoella complicata NRRL Y-17804]